MEVKLVNTSCPVEIGDRFYRDKPNQTIPDMLEVMETWKKRDTLADPRQVSLSHDRAGA